ncbi:MAG: hypothetical protein GQ477_05480 [Nanohaloarchaea archaeon]|nr:hypothetical protein [Candidatus Nanohaloarchaea archaeon]
MEKKDKLRIFTQTKENKTALKKELDLPIYLSDIGSFSVYLHKQCGCHIFHIEFETKYNKWLTLCNIRLKKNKKTGISYQFPDEEDRHRLMLYLNKNKKTRNRLKLAETTSTAQKKKKNIDEAYYYG